MPKDHEQSLVERLDTALDAVADVLDHKWDPVAEDYVSEEWRTVFRLLGAAREAYDVLAPKPAPTDEGEEP